MNDVDEKITKNRNMLYYNQMMKSDRVTQHQAKKKETKSKSFASKKVELKDFAPVPEGWEFFVYTFYVVALPYILGAVFLFLVIARGSVDNFMLLNINAFPIVWLIGYEIASVIMLCWILVLYLQHDSEEVYY
ncbi:MAG: hypothetical protein JXQ67_09135 [Campylobacterales bacterium]|nr:hypothetical protein [Campylobacterales bacterium]